MKSISRINNHNMPYQHWKTSVFEPENKPMESKKQIRPLPSSRYFDFRKIKRNFDIFIIGLATKPPKI